GTVVRNARIALTPLDGKGGPLTTTTSARGRFDFAHVEKGRYRLSVDYDVSGVFGCTLGYPAEVRAGKILARRVAVPIVDVAPSGRFAKLPDGQRVACRILQDPLEAFFCQGVRLPLTLFALPPRDIFDGSGYRRLGSISKSTCGRLSLHGRLPGGRPL